MWHFANLLGFNNVRIVMCRFFCRHVGYIVTSPQTSFIIVSHPFLIESGSPPDILESLHGHFPHARMGSAGAGSHAARVGHLVLQRVRPRWRPSGHRRVVVEPIPANVVHMFVLISYVTLIPHLLSMLNILSPPTARKGALMPLMSPGLTPPNLTSSSASPTTSLAHFSSLKFVPKEWVTVWEAIS